MRARHAAAAHQARVINLPRGVVVREHLGGLRDGERQQGGDERLERDSFVFWDRKKDG